MICMDCREIFIVVNIIAFYNIDLATLKFTSTTLEIKLIQKHPMILSELNSLSWKFALRFKESKHSG